VWWQLTCGGSWPVVAADLRWQLACGGSRPAAAAGLWWRQRSRGLALFPLSP